MARRPVSLTSPSAAPAVRPSFLFQQPAEFISASAPCSVWSLAGIFLHRISPRAAPFCYSGLRANTLCEDSPVQSSCWTVSVKCGYFVFVPAAHTSLWNYPVYLCPVYFPFSTGISTRRATIVFGVCFGHCCTQCLCSKYLRMFVKQIKK